MDNLSHNKSFTLSVIHKSVSDIYEQAIEEWTITFPIRDTPSIGEPTHWLAQNRLNGEQISVPVDVITSCCCKHAKEVYRLRSKLRTYTGDRGMCSACGNFYVIPSNVKEEWKNVCETCSSSGRIKPSVAYIEVAYVKCATCDGRIPPNPNRPKCTACEPVLITYRACGRCKRHVIPSTDPAIKTMCPPCFVITKKEKAATTPKQCQRGCTMCSANIPDRPPHHKVCVSCYPKALKK